MQTLSVFLVDDHAPFRHCLRGLLSVVPGLRVVGEADGGAALLAAARAAAPQPLADVVLMDVALRGDTGMALTRQLQAVLPASRVLALSLHDDPLLVQAMREAGAAGYRLKSEPLPQLLQAIARVGAGGRAFGPPDAP